MVPKPPLVGLLPFRGGAVGRHRDQLWITHPVWGTQPLVSVTGPFDTSADGERLAYVDDKQLVIVGGGHDPVPIPDGTEITALGWGPQQLIVGLRELSPEGEQSFALEVRDLDGLTLTRWTLKVPILDVAWSEAGPLLVTERDGIVLQDRASGPRGIGTDGVLIQDGRRLLRAPGALQPCVEATDSRTWALVGLRCGPRWRLEGDVLVPVVTEGREGSGVRRWLMRPGARSLALDPQGGWSASRGRRAGGSVTPAIGGGWLVTVGPTTLWVWPPPWSEPQPLARPRRPLLAVAISPSGRSIAAVDGRTLWLWRDGLLTLRRPAGADQVQFIDEERLVTAGARWIRWTVDGVRGRGLRPIERGAPQLLTAAGEVYAWSAPHQRLWRWGPDGPALLHVGAIPRLGGPDTPLIVAWHDELWQLGSGGPGVKLGALASPEASAPLPGGTWGIVRGGGEYLSLAPLDALPPGQQAIVFDGDRVEALGAPTPCGLPPLGPARSPRDVITLSFRSPEAASWSVVLAASDRWSHVHMDPDGGLVVHDGADPEQLSTACRDRRHSDGGDVAAGIRQAAALAGPDGVVVLVDGVRGLPEQLRGIRAALELLGDVPLLVGIPEPAPEGGLDTSAARLVWELLVGAEQVARPGETAGALLERWTEGS
ncbi:MAG TPA: hypothetical protein ENK18_23035 [Deltaproteobacteria bacterium]|nr:hypothetical protein [Deltaproteobacteria bacterium]